MFEDAAAIAEVVGAIGVMISLVFVGLQMQQANKLARNAAQQKQIESIRDISRLIIENPVIGDLLTRKPGAELTPSERVFLFAFMSYGERMWEGLYEQYRQGLVDPEVWEAHRRQARAVQADPLNEAVWQVRKGWYSERYQKFRDADSAGPMPTKLSYDLEAPAAPPAQPPKP